MKKQRGLPATPRKLDLRGGRGQTLLETLLALSASVLILSAVIVVVVSSLNGTQFTKNKNLANQYAREGIEIVRKIRDSGGWTGFSAINGRYCLSGGSASLPSSSPSCTTPNIGGIFVREINVYNPLSPEAILDCLSGGPGSNGSKVTSIVSWSSGKCPAGNYCHKVQLISCFYNTDQKTAP